MAFFSITPIAFTSIACETKQNMMDTMIIETKVVNFDTIFTFAQALELACHVHYPPAVLKARLANKDSYLPNKGRINGVAPVHAREGNIVVFSALARNRLEEDFGHNPEEFFPERWASLPGDMSGFIPFNKQPRICTGCKFPNF